MKYIGIIWNPVYYNCDNIKKDIKKYGRIIKSLDLDLSSEFLSDFIDNLYNYGKDEKWKTEYKKNDLIFYNDRKICALEIEINDEEFIINSKGRKVLKKAQELKDYIRDNYRYDMNKKEIYKENAFHLTDNEEEYEYQKSIVKKYSRMTFVDDIESASYYDTLPRFSKEVYDYLEKLGVKNKVVADIGCGTGRIAIDLLERNNTVYAIDPDKNMRSICEKKCGKYDKFISVNGIDSNMNIPDKSVNYIIVSQSFHRFNLKQFKKECNRVLKNRNNIIIIWYRIDFNNPIYSEMLKSIKKNYSDYEIRYDTDEINGAILEEKSNNEETYEFFRGKCHIEEIMSYSYLDLDNFLRLGLSLVIFPITHKLNNTKDVLEQSSFNKEEFIKDLTNIFDKYSNDNLIKLEFRVQIHSKEK